MALMRAKPADIPADAICMTEDEAIQHQWRIVSEHEEQAILTPIRFGPGILGAMGGITGMLVNNHYRSRLRLGKFGYVGSYVPIAVLPAIVGTFFHRGIVQARILLEKDKCPLCLQMRAAAMHGFLGTVYPAVLAPFAAYMYAVRHYTFRLPSIIDEPRALLRVYVKMTRPILPALGVALGVNALTASYITYREQIAYALLQARLREEERSIDRRRGRTSGEYEIVHQTSRSTASEFVQ